MSRLRCRLAVPVGIALIASLTAACGGSESTGGNGLEKQTVTVAALPVVDTAGLHIAIQQKFFAAEGLRVQVKPVAQSIQALPALKTGQVDVIAGGNYVTFLQAHAKRTLDLRILAAGAAVAPRFMAVRTMPGSPIRQPRDLQGKTVAVNILNNIQSLTLNEILKANNVDPATVEYRAIPFPQMGAALQKGQVDAVHTAEPFGTDIERKLDARLVLDGGAGPVAGLPVSGYLTTRRFVSRYPKTAAAFQRAIGKAQRLATGDRTKVDQILPSYAHLDAKTASALHPPAFPAFVDAGSMQRLADLMLRNGLLTTAIDAKSLIFVPGAK
jgi:NitT/TauT family transport system substrate-binding protein